MSKKLVSTGHSCSALILLLDGLLKTSFTLRVQLVSQLRKLIGELTYALDIIQMVQPLMVTQNQLLLKGVSGSDLSSLVSYHSNALVVVGLLKEFVTRGKKQSHRQTNGRHAHTVITKIIMKKEPTLFSLSKKYLALLRLFFMKKYALLKVSLKKIIYLKN